MQQVMLASELPCTSALVRSIERRVLLDHQAMAWSHPTDA
jgi:hypothetical protein